MAWPETWTRTVPAQRVRFGAGQVAAVGDAVREVGLRRVLLVTTTGRHESEAGVAVVRALGRSLTSVFDAAGSQVPVTVVQDALARARLDGVDGIVSLGGGSCVDLAKAVAFFLEQEAGTPAATHLDRPALPHVAVPTTYAGAEASGAFTMRDERSRTRSGGRRSTLVPVSVIYDAELHAELGPAATAASGLMALGHCIEVLVSPQRTPSAEALALAALSTITRSLPDVVDQPDDDAARSVLLAGASMAARAQAESVPGVHHALAELLAARTGAADAVVHAVLLPHALRFNADGMGAQDLARIGAGLGDPEDPAGAVARLVERLGLPPGLEALGATPEDLDVVARMAQGHEGVQRNVRPVGELDARAILADAA